MLKKTAIFTRDVLSNLWSNMSGCKLTHIVEANDWAIKNVGMSVTDSLNTHQLLHSRISTTPIGLRNQIIHFDSVHTFVKKNPLIRPTLSNNIILTWFHVLEGDKRVKRLADIQKEIHAIHTACESTKRALVEGGIDPKKIVIIPLGVDLNLFKPVTKTSCRVVRERLGIPQNRFVIGSFQKDGVGWSEGLEPKLEKGPDVFVGVIERLKKIHPFVLLTGPARGYVKSELKKRNIDYLHIYPKNFHELPNLYHTLDLYLISSRVEGGPLSLLESWASRVPVVSTRVGMVPDIARDGETVLLAEIEDTYTLTNHVERLHDDPNLREKLASQALKKVTNHSWNTIARCYFEELYRPLL